MTIALLLLLGYLCGAVPVAVLVAKARGVDVFAIGTGNPGAANVFRRIGRGAGLTVLAGDLLKGAVPVVASYALGEGPWVAWGAGMAALVGHWYSVFLRFRGGAGLATAIGAGVVLLPLPALVAIPPALAWLAWRKDVGATAGVGYLLFFVAAVALFREPVALALAITVTPALALARERFLPKVGGNGRTPVMGSTGQD